jgi:hypothetical protein
LTQLEILPAREKIGRLMIAMAVFRQLAAGQRFLRYTPTVQNEQPIIEAFVKRNKRDRYREILSCPRLRHKFANQLAHFTDFDPQYRVPIPSNKLFVYNTALELQRRHSPSIVFAILRHLFSSV